MTSVSTRLTWAVPVKPDELGMCLEAFKQVLPKLQALRLCYRFGKGPKVGITKLPVEVEQMIEGLLVKSYLSRWHGAWCERFMHFEKRCEPVSHLSTGYLDILPGIEKQYSHELCEECKVKGTMTGDFDPRYTCDGECHALMHEHVNDYVLNNDLDDLDWCNEQSKEWEQMISQSAGGNFEKYDKILYQYFGLCAHFANTRMSGKNGPWPEPDAGEWYGWDDLRTTICYLALPDSPSVDTKYQTSDMESMSEAGVIRIEGHQSSFVKPVDMSERDDIARRFHRALRTLTLAPYVHESQLHTTLFTALSKSRDDSTIDTQQSKSSEPAGKMASTHSPHRSSSKKNIASCTHELEWPKIVLLVSSTACLKRGSRSRGASLWNLH